ncbi:MAG: hypothetical protein AAFV53_33800 [Myxococcota bacterium]
MTYSQLKLPIARRQAGLTVLERVKIQPLDDLIREEDLDIGDGIWCQIASDEQRMSRGDEAEAALPSILCLRQFSRNALNRGDRPFEQRLDHQSTLCLCFEGVGLLSFQVLSCLRLGAGIKEKHVLPTFIDGEHDVQIIIEAQEQRSPLRPEWLIRS